MPIRSQIIIIFYIKQFKYLGYARFIKGEIEGNEALSFKFRSCFVPNPRFYNL